MTVFGEKSRIRWHHIETHHSNKKYYFLDVRRFCGSRIEDKRVNSNSNKIQVQKVLDGGTNVSGKNSFSLVFEAGLRAPWIRKRRV